MVFLWSPSLNSHYWNSCTINPTLVLLDLIAFQFSGDFVRCSLLRRIPGSRPFSVFSHILHDCLWLLPLNLPWFKVFYLHWRERKPAPLSPNAGFLIHIPKEDWKSSYHVIYTWNSSCSITGGFSNMANEL